MSSFNYEMPPLSWPAATDAVIEIEDRHLPDSERVFLPSSGHFIECPVSRPQLLGTL